MNRDMLRPTLPWWRVPTAWLVFGGPALVVAASFATLALAVHGGDTPLRESTVQAGAHAPATQARNHVTAPRQR